MSLSSVIQNHRNLNAIIRVLHDVGGHCYLVGGCVRDHLLGLESHNFDLEVFGLTSQQIIDAIQPHYGIDAVGKSYGILKVRDVDIDIGVPRKEVKTGQLHTDFIVQEAPDLPIDEAIRRRDFTINAIYYDTKSQQFIDPYNGIDDLKNRLLRPTSERFGEDPLRVLRGMQFCARFELLPTPETIRACEQLTPEHLSSERMYQEFVKLLIQGKTISRGLRFLQQTGWTRYFPEIHNLIGVKQDPARHPEGDVFEHVCCAMDAFATKRTGNFDDDLTVGFALLCHDFGKATTTFRDARGIHSYWHEIAGILPAKNFMERLGIPKRIVLQALTLVQYHMEPRRYFKRSASDADFRRLAYNVRRLDLLVIVGYCDCFGRIDNNEEIFDWISTRACELGVYKSPPKAIIQGRHLISIGLQPDKGFSKILLNTYFAQLNGDFDDVEGGLRYVRKSLLSCAAMPSPSVDLSLRRSS